MSNRTPPTLALRTAAGLLLAAAAGLSAAAQDQKDQKEQKAQLQRARSLLGGIQEAQVAEGGQICVDLNSPEAVDLLLETLAETRPRSSRHLPPAHYRDVVWDALIAITDPYARRRVHDELVRNKDDALVRQWCVELLGIYGDASLAPAVLRATKDHDTGVRRWAARSLGMMRFEPAVKELLRLSHGKDPYVRANALEALARIDVATHGEALVEAARHDADAGVRCALLGATPELLPERAETLSADALRDPDWRPRMQGVQNLGGIVTKTAVDALVTALADGRPVVAARALEALQKLTGKPIAQHEVWPKWWADNRATFEFPAGEGEAPAGDERRTLTYNGIRIVSDHCAFLIDKSFRMNAPLKSKGVSKDEAARDELARVLDLVGEDLVFNVFLYHEEVRPLGKKPIELTPRAKKLALAFVGGEAKGKAKDIWQALESVIDDPTLDTAYLLSSGEPDIGTYVHWNRVTRHLRDLNRFHKVTVHTIAYSGSEWFRDQLQKIAEATGGQFEWFQ